MNTVIRSGEYTAVVNSFGAELCSLRDKSGREYIWQADPDVWKRHAPVLFPFVCSTDSKKYTVNGTEYSMSNHGFARDSEFQLAELTENKVSFKLVSDDDTRKLYPYDFEFTVSYQLWGGKVTCTFSALNTGDKVMHCFIGGHPAFNCPMAEGESFDDYYVKYEKSETVIQELPDGRKITVADNTDTVNITRELFANDVFMKDSPESSEISLIGRKSGRGIRVCYDNGGCIAVWSPATDKASFVCLEPWSSVPVYCDRTEELTEMPHALKIQPEEKYDFEFTIEII
ncbi:MAG: aldose 1-epimerase family protein [Oscillospiraceae bacterium]|nr:aldose 1-epimerase family protein [Oscillospiraceae bacterium]